MGEESADNRTIEVRFFVEGPMEDDARLVEYWS